MDFNQWMAGKGWTFNSPDGEGGYWSNGEDRLAEDQLSQLQSQYGEESNPNSYQNQIARGIIPTDEFGILTALKQHGVDPAAYYNTVYGPGTLSPDQQTYTPNDPGAAANPVHPIDLGWSAYDPMGEMVKAGLIATVTGQIPGIMTQLGGSLSAALNPGWTSGYDIAKGGALAGWAPAASGAASLLSNPVGQIIQNGAAQTVSNATGIPAPLASAGISGIGKLATGLTTPSAGSPNLSYQANNGSDGSASNPLDLSVTPTGDNMSGLTDMLGSFAGSGPSWLTGGDAGSPGFSLAGAMGDGFLNLSNMFGSGLDNINSSMGQIPQWLSNYSSNFSNALYGMGNDFSGSLASNNQALMNAFGSGTSAINNNLDQMNQNLTSGVSNLGNIFGDGFANLSNQFGSGLTGIGDAMGSGFSSLGDLFSQGLTGLGNGIGSIASGLGTGLGSLGTGIAQAFGGMSSGANGNNALIGSLLGGLLASQMGKANPATSSTTSGPQYTPEEAAARSNIFSNAKSLFDQNSAAVANSPYPGAKPVGPSAPTTDAWAQMLGYADGAGAQNSKQLQDAQTYGLTTAMDVNNNPALKGAIDAAIHPINDAFTDAGGVFSQIRNNSQLNGQPGGTRQGIAEGIAGKKYLQTVGDITAKMMSDAYSKGQDTFAKTLALAPNTQQTVIQPGMIKSGVGTQQEGYQQAQNDYTGNANMWKLNAPWTPLQNYTNIIYGGSHPSTTTTATANPPQSSTFNNVLGGAMMGGSLFGGGNKSNNGQMFSFFGG